MWRALFEVVVPIVAATLVALDTQRAVPIAVVVAVGLVGLTAATAFAGLVALVASPIDLAGTALPVAPIEVAA